MTPSSVSVRPQQQRKNSSVGRFALGCLGLFAVIAFIILVSAIINVRRDIAANTQAPTPSPTSTPVPARTAADRKAWAAKHQKGWGSLEFSSARVSGPENTTITFITDVYGNTDLDVLKILNDGRKFDPVWEQGFRKITIRHEPTGREVSSQR